MESFDQQLKQVIKINTMIDLLIYVIIPWQLVPVPYYESLFVMNDSSSNTINNNIK
jgi:hypothetical protein